MLFVKGKPWRMHKPIYIRNGLLIDPSQDRSENADLFILDGRIAPLPATPPADALVIDASGLVVAPGFIDLHVHLREPGGEDAETVETGSKAAARGGFTTIVSMPNTLPPIDIPDRVAFVKKRAGDVGLVRVLPSACITQGREGLVLTELEQLALAGAAAFTDDGSTVPADELMRLAMERAARLSLPVMDHAHHRDLERKGVMHEGEFSKRWKLPGIPSAAESRVVERDIDLARRTGCSLHIQHVSTRESVELIRRARGQGLRITGEATPHHLALTDADIDPANANFKMNPPLRSREDRQALIDGIRDGVLTTFATDHAPHTAQAKARGFLEAPFGIVGLETAVGITHTLLVKPGIIDRPTWIRRWTVGPAQVLGLKPPSLVTGATADLVLLDLSKEWTVRADQFQSRSRNTPFEGWKLTGQAAVTIRQGKITWSREKPTLTR